MQGFKFLDDLDRCPLGDVLVAELPSNVLNQDQLFRLMCDKLNFPAYFGFNWDALFDCLRDFHWIEAKNIVLIHRSLPLLEDEELKIYLEILRDSCLDWQPEQEHTLEVVFPRAEKTRINRLLVGRG